MDPARAQRPNLSYAQTDTLNHGYGRNEDVSLDEQAAVLQAMSLETPAEAGLTQSPTTYSSGSSYHTLRSTVSLSTLNSPTSPINPTNEKPKAGQIFKSALQDARHFAGGLISHPYESTKHYSILRHSHGLVYYTGTSTNLAITIFSDRDLPIDRTLWLQRKGFSGKTGLKIGGLLGARSTWVNVTPAVRATPAQLEPTDERAWQRDIKKFLKKAPKEIRSHLVRETDILRIPCEADDGYLRVVLCTADGKKVLCGSPIFRLASSSTDGSSIRGASLVTMPLEVGIKIASVVANNAVAATLSPAAETARTFVSTKVSQIYQPSAILQSTVTTAYDSSGMQGHIDRANEQYDRKRDESFNATNTTAFDALARADIIGDESGPNSPFPVMFQGKVIPGSGTSTVQWNMPTANLTAVSEDILLRHRGVYFGWAAIHLPTKVAVEKELSSDWHQAIIFIAPDPTARRTVVHKNTARVYVIHDFQATLFFDAKLSVMMMGFLRHVHVDESAELGGRDPDRDAQLFDVYKDIAVATASLARPNWQADATLERVESAASARSFRDRYVDLRQSSQRHIDRVPVHMLGIRTEGAGLKDRLIGNGGVCVPRQGLTHTFTA
ncbi:hypothetical protein LTR84_009812 [Exophiala bonariae]|uniref:Riboflavin kinase n=1 Tax=Exophiala bonariae TaxID=1690606 RepID=A0AAV9NKG6_9EURO|nr:hypothetical protein LTR84_009812 [Exophiala bonariae]